MISFVIGNGNSRSLFSLENLRPLGTTYGCNALYRDFIPEVLVAVDERMIRELAEQNPPCKVYVRKLFGTQGETKFEVIKPSLGWASGPTAVWLATQSTTSVICMIGFDCSSLENGNINNIYAGSNNYASKDSKQCSTVSWERQLDEVVKNTPHISFVRVVTAQTKSLPIRYNNYKEILDTDFESFIFSKTS